jgi:hypothetical protein
MTVRENGGYMRVEPTEVISAINRQFLKHLELQMWGNGYMTLGYLTLGYPTLGYLTPG